MNEPASAKRHLLFIGFTVALSLLAFGPLRRVIALAFDNGNTDSSHIVLIPFITGALLLYRRAAIFSEARTSIIPAVIACALAAALQYAARTFESRLTPNDYLSLTTASIIVFWFGGFLAVYGAKAFKAGIFPLLFLLLAIPIPSWLFHRTASLLQHGSASVVSMLFALTGTPAYRDNVTFMLPGLTIEVAEECSGIRSTLGIFIVTLLGAHLLLESNWKKTALLLAVVPISLFKNALRIAALSLLAIHWDMDFMTGRLHHEGGIVFMMIGLGLLYPFLVLLIRLEGKKLVSGVQS